MTEEEFDLIIAEQNKSTEEILKAIVKVKSDYHELCKLKDMRIAELEDKLANADYQLEGRDIKIKELEKENAELKKESDFYHREKGEYKSTFLHQVVLTNRVNRKLTKAKELLERLLITSCNSDVLNLLPNCSEVLRVRVEAEQFLSEVEK